ncbi:hypothetical protein T265_04340 [Opisthorchis viverrini]|uniref:Uncharacterized protein n=1 Tax=Opisthorchis viverrini TaxID=6198 RepID=A0A074ZPA3_OPIVI|nr:hypothetical protein T265_04340 [Opisthorchis viverrini]KER28961.1 hypothetical protein T265_04340 [Opisthorchis viverrini]
MPVHLDFPHLGAQHNGRGREPVPQNVLECSDSQGLCTKLSDESLARLRKIVDRQKAELQFGQSDESEKAQEEPDFLLEPSERPLLRKVTEGLLPPTYFGFSFSQTNGLLVNDFEQAVYHRRSLTIPSRLLRQKRIQDKPNKRMVKRIVANESDPSTHDHSRKLEEYGPGSWRVGQELIRRHFGMKRSSKEDELEQEGNVASAKRSVENPHGSLIAHSDGDGTTRHGDPMQYEKDDLPAPKTLNGLKRGLYRRERHMNVNDCPNTDGTVCNRKTNVSRADLQALVRRQRQIRKEDRRRKEQAETERRERIKRNLSATALAAAAAAKAPVSPNKKKIRMAYGESFQPNAKISTELLPMSAGSIALQQKLDELLGTDDDHYRLSELTTHVPNESFIADSMQIGPELTSSRSVAPSVANTESQNAGFRGGSRLQPTSIADPPTQEFQLHDTPTRLPPAHEVAATKDFVASPTVVSDFIRSSKATPISHPEFPCLGQLERKTNNFNSFSSSSYLSVPGSAHADELLTLDTDNANARDGTSTSSCGDISPSGPGRWIRLEAIGASEPELAIEDEEKGEFVDDMKPEPLVLSEQVRNCVIRKLHKANLPLGDSRSEHPMHKPLDEVKRSIYSDPLRFIKIHKRQQSRGLETVRTQPVGDRKQPEETVHEEGKLHTSELAGGIQLNRPLDGYDANTTSESHIDCHHPAVNMSSTGSPTENLPSSFKANDANSSSPGSQVRRDFILHASECAVSSTPRQEHAMTERRQKVNGLENKADHAPPRLTAAALSLQLSAEMNQLEALTTSIQHLTEMESLRQFAVAQAETVGLAQLLKIGRSNADSTLIPRPSEEHAKSPEKRSQCTSMIPDSTRSGHRSPHYESVLRAAAEFHKVERRLSEHRTELRSSRRIEDKSIGSPLSATSVPSSSSEKQVSTSTNSENVKNECVRKSKTISTTPSLSVQSKTTASEISTDLSGSVSACENASSLPVEALSAAVDSSRAASVSTKLEGSPLIGEKHSRIAVAEESSSSTPPLVGDKRSPKHLRSKPTNKLRPPEDPSDTVSSGALALVDSVLAERAAILKARREKAQRLLTISKNLEKEEGEVVHLERTALKAAQSKRRQIRSIRTSDAPSSAEKHRVKDPTPTESVVYSSDFAPSVTTGRSGSQRLPVAAAEAISSIRESISLSQSGPTGKTSIRKSSASSLLIEIQPSLISDSRPRDRSQSASQVRSVSTTASAAVGGIPRTSPISKMQTGVLTGKSVVTSISSRPTCGQSPTVENEHEPAGEQHRLPVTVIPSTLPKDVTPGIASSSSERTTSPTPHRRRRSPLPLPGRRSRHSSSNLSGPLSAESMDDELGVCSDAADLDEQSSQVDISEMESRIHALHTNLLKQERLLSRINKLSKRGSKDRLSRFQATLVQHKQLCTEIIHNIKTQLDACQSSMHLEKSAMSARDASQISAKSPWSAQLDLSKLDGSTKAVPLPSVESNEPDSPVDLVASLADEAAFATDTEGDLQKLEFDDKSEPLGVRTTADDRNHAVSSDQDEETASASEATLVSNGENVPLHDDTPHVEPRSSLQELGTENIPSSLTADVKPAREALEISDRLTDVDFENETFSRTITVSDDKSAPLRTPLSENVAQPSADESLTHLEPPLRSAAVTVSSHVYNTLLNVTEPLSTSDALLVDKNQVDIPCKPLTRSPSVKVGAVSAMCRGNGMVEQSLESSTETSGAATDHLAPTTKTSTLLVDKVTDELFARILSDSMDSTIGLSKARAMSKQCVEVTNKDSLQNQAADKFADEAEPVASVVAPEDVDDSWDNECSSGSNEGDDYSTTVSPARLFTEENLRGLVADIPSRTSPLISEAVSFLWNARLNASDGSRESALLAAMSDLPEIFQSHWTDPWDLNPELHVLPNLRFVNRSLLFDLAAEFIQQIYSGEDAEYEARVHQNAPKPRITSAQFRLWKGSTRPATYDALLPLVESYLKEELQLNASVTEGSNPQNLTKPETTGYGRMTLSRLVQWTLSKKPRLDRLLELDIRADDGSWLAYGPEEARLKHKLSEEIWDEMLTEALDAMLRSFRRTFRQSSHQSPTELSAAAS